MGSVDDRTFKADFTVDGVSKLRDRVKDKLKEFMGDYTDDTLVEYVIVLLRNGRRKEEARNELNVFLGDDSDAFVSWLWDHLTSNLNLYIHPEESHVNEATKAKPTSAIQAGSNGPPIVDSEIGGNKLSRSRHNREWKGAMREADPPPLRSSVVADIHHGERTNREVGRGRRSISPRQSKGLKKRSRTEERQHTKKEVVVQKTIDAPRRILQFAVRDAVGTTRPSSSVKEPSSKRLRSVVSTSTGNSDLVECPPRIRSVATMPNSLATVIKAVAEAADDVNKFKSGRNVFDRLGRGVDVTQMVDDDPVAFREAPVDEDYENFVHIQDHTSSQYLDGHSLHGQYDEDMSLLESRTALPYNSTSDNERYEDVSVTDLRAADISRSRLSVGNRVEDSLMHYTAADIADDTVPTSWNNHQHYPSVPISSSRKGVSVSANANTWKPHHYQEILGGTELDSRFSNQNVKALDGKSVMQSMQENGNPTTVGNGKTTPVAPAAFTHVEPQKALSSSASPGLHAAGRPSDDADSRTIFVNNVHFAATKDSLSRHFNKFGEVLKVIIVTDAATGQPKGSAYVEFMRKEAAENALTLDGTSFMSRILKVVKRSAAQPDAASLTSWPRARGSPFAAARFTRPPFPRGLQGGFRPRLPIKPGARSLQWKRDAQPSPTETTTAQTPANNIIPPTPRSLTYIRPESKTDGTPSATS